MHVPVGWRGIRAPAQNRRIDHAEDHRHMGHHQENGQQDEVELQLLIRGLAPAEDASSSSEMAKSGMTPLR